MLENNLISYDDQLMAMEVTAQAVALMKEVQSLVDSKKFNKRFTAPARALLQLLQAYLDDPNTEMKVSPSFFLHRGTYWKGLALELQAKKKAKKRARRKLMARAHRRLKFIATCSPQIRLEAKALVDAYKRYRAGVRPFAEPRSFDDLVLGPEEFLEKTEKFTPTSPKADAAALLAEPETAKAA